MDVEDLFAPIQAHGFDLYLNGHVHTLTQYSVDGNPAFVTSGAGAMIKTQDQGARAATTGICRDPAVMHIPKTSRAWLALPPPHSSALARIVTQRMSAPL